MPRTTILAVLTLASLAACTGSGSEGETTDTASAATTDTPTTAPTTEDPSSETSAGSGDGDGDPAGDGDGDPPGDGDGDPPGDGDGDPPGDEDSDSGVKFDLGDPDIDASTTGIDESSDIAVVITGDNAYGFGYGSEDGINNYYGGIENTTAGQIFNCNGGPEEYLIPAEEVAFASYLYIVGYADSSVTQGVLGRFRRVDGDFGDSVFTGDPEWEVCATGMNYSPGSGGPDEATIDLMIQACNDNALDPMISSVGWVDSEGTEFGALAIGEDNTTPYNGGPQVGNEFPITCQMKMDLDARWMWFNWDPENIEWPQQSPFLWPGGGSNPDHQFLLFRLASNTIPPPA